MENLLLRIAAIVTALSVIIGACVKTKKWIKSKKEKKAAFENQVLESLQQINSNMNLISDDVVMIIRDRLKSAHGYYMRAGWCPAVEKGSLLEMYDTYTDKGHNSLISSYAEDISSLPEFPNKSRTADACGIRPM